MMESASFWLVCNLLTIVTLAFFSMEEMAIVSFNKVRMQFYVSKGNKKAIKLNELLKNPTVLFGTTLIGVNVATFVGSECARRFHEAISLSPDLAPISQVFLVIVFGELAPMFAARRYAEHVALLGIPLLTFCSWLLYPFIVALGYISKLANRLIGGQESLPNVFLTEDELKKLLEEQDEERLATSETEEMNDMTSNIFRLRSQVASNIMTPLTSGPLISSQTTVGQLRKMAITDSYVIVYHKEIERIAGVVYIKQLLRAGDHKKLYEFCSPPWFISTNTPLMQSLKQFKRNSENIAIVLNEKGTAVGYLVFEDIIDSIFQRGFIKSVSSPQTFIDRSVAGDKTLGEIEHELGINLPGDKNITISEWITSQLEHHPEVDESITVPPFEIIVKEVSFLDVKTVQIRTQV